MIVCNKELNNIANPKKYICIFNIKIENKIAINILEFKYIDGNAALKKIL